jgi:hypothetical protein
MARDVLQKRIHQFAQWYQFNDWGIEDVISIFGLQDEYLKGFEENCLTLKSALVAPSVIKCFVVAEEAATCHRPLIFNPPRPLIVIQFYMTLSVLHHQSLRRHG